MAVYTRSMGRSPTGPIAVSNDAARHYEHVREMGVWELHMKGEPSPEAAATKRSMQRLHTLIRIHGIVVQV